MGNRNAFKHGARSASTASLIRKIRELTAAGNALAEHSTTMTSNKPNGA